MCMKLQSERAWLLCGQLAHTHMFFSNSGMTLAEWRCEGGPKLVRSDRLDRGEALKSRKIVRPVRSSARRWRILNTSERSITDRSERYSCWALSPGFAPCLTTFYFCCSRLLHGAIAGLNLSVLSLQNTGRLVRSSNRSRACINDELIAMLSHSHSE